MKEPLAQLANKEDDSKGTLWELLHRLKAAACGSVGGSRAAGGLEDDHWLCPIEDRRRQGSRREGLLEGCSLGSYFCTNRERLRELARQRGVHHLDNLTASPA